MAAADCSGWRRFAVACGVLSRRVRAEAARGKIMAGAAHACPDATVEPPTMLLMPGADVAPDVRDEAPSTPAGGAAQAQAQLTIMYGGRVLVFDDVPADRAAELMRVAAAAQDVPGGLADMPVTRKASLQRFMEKRRDRHAGRAPYAKASTNGKEKGEAGWWLGLGIPGGWER